jgi:predicted amidophosphoribosyltransferase
MREIRGLALGTYYAAGANAAKETPNASAMRGLVYAVKDNRDPPNPKQLINHPLHPAGRAITVDRTNAIEYVTAMLANRIAKLTKFFGTEDPRAITLVPVPSSEVTATTIESTRFRTLRLCRALAGVGLGTVEVLAVQRKPVVAKTKGSRRTANEILAGFTRTATPIPRATTIVLVDDNVQSGKSIAALDRLLGASRPTYAFAVAVTDSQPSADALKARGFTIEYDDEDAALDVRCTLDAVR